MDLINKYLQEQTPGHEYEYDYEGDMAKTQLNMMIDASTELKSMLQNNTNLPEWVQSKITKAADYIDSARDYMKNMNKDSNGNMHNEPMGEQTMSDTGWKASQKTRKDQYGNVQKTSNVAKSLARKAMKSAMSDLKKGPEAGKRQVEEVEDLEELKQDTLASYADKAEKDIKAKKAEFVAQGGQMRKKSQRALDAKISNRYKGLFKAQGKAGLPYGFKEEVEQIDELDKVLTKYVTRTKFSSDPKRRMGAQRAMAKLDQKSKEKKNQTVTEAMDHAQMAAMHSAKAEEHGKMAASYHGTDSSDLADRHMELYNAHKDAAAAHSQAAKSNNPEDAKKAEEAHKDAQWLSKQYNESVELDEAETSKLYNYAFDKYADITSGKNKKDKAKAPGYERIARNAFKMGISRPLKKPNLPEEVELEEALRHEIAGAVAQFIGNKIDPVHGEIMRVHGREGYRQAATHIRKTISDVKDAVSGLHDRLHKQLRTGGLTTEETELEESGGDVVWKKGNDHIEKYGDEKFALYKDGKKTKFYKSVGDAKAALSEGKYGSFRVRTTSGTFGGPKLPRRSYVPQGDQDPRSGLPLGFSNPPEKSEKPENNQGSRLDKVRKAMRSSS